ncbi:hypothetical protein [Streptacidiphilus sp. PAMC 29251]
MRDEMVGAVQGGLEKLRETDTVLRQELRAGLGELREELRALHAELRALHSDLNDASRDVADSHRQMEALRLALKSSGSRVPQGGVSGSEEAAAVPAQRAAPTSGGPLLPSSGTASPEPEVLPSAASHQARLEKVAGISAADLVCHRDTWAFLVEQAAHDVHFRVPGEVSAGEDGGVRVTLSGRSLIAVLTALHAASHPAPGGDLGDWALSKRFYQRIADAVDTVSPNFSRPVLPTSQPHGTAPARTLIVIDDRPASPSTHEGPSTPGIGSDDIEGESHE